MVNASSASCPRQILVDEAETRDKVLNGIFTKFQKWAKLELQKLDVYQFDAELGRYVVGNNNEFRYILCMRALIWSLFLLFQRSHEYCIQCCSQRYKRQVLRESSTQVGVLWNLIVMMMMMCDGGSN